MLIDFSQPITNMEGEPIKQVDDKGEPTDRVVTLSSVCVNSLMASIPDAQGRAVVESGEEKLKRYNLAQKIYEKKEVELKAEEITKIKEMVGKTSTTLVVGQAFIMLEKKKLSSKISK